MKSRLASLTLALSACSPSPWPGQEEITAHRIDPSAASSENIPQELFLGAITDTLRIVSDSRNRGIFVSSATGLPVEIRGANYVRLKPTGTTLYHSTFSLGGYDGARAQAALAGLKESGYNSVRVFIEFTENSGIVSGLTSPGLNSLYLANLYNFLGMARANGIRVTITTQWAPANYAAFYAYRSNGVGGINGLYLNPQYLEANTKFYQDLAAAIAKAGYEDTIFSFDLHNKGEFSATEHPLGATQGIFKAPNGKSYNLASAQEKESMRDDAVVYWINRASSAIRFALKRPFITQSVFSSTLVQGTSRLPFRLKAVSASSANYLDKHLYAATAEAIEPELRALGVFELNSKKPLLAGEIGVLSQNSVPNAASQLRSMYTKSCESGYRGWLFWTWNTEEQPEWHNLMRSAGAINGVFAPIAQQLTCPTIPLRPIQNPSCFNETGYLQANKDVADAVLGGVFASGFDHYISHG